MPRSMGIFGPPPPSDVPVRVHIKRNGVDVSGRSFRVIAVAPYFKTDASHEKQFPNLTSPSDGMLSPELLHHLGRRLGYGHPRHRRAARRYKPRQSKMRLDLALL